MKVHCLLHAAHEGLGCIAPWLLQRGYQVSESRLHAGDALPKATAFDWLILMGGPMNVYEYDKHPWLVAEKSLINDASVMNKKILGICLGAQLVADVFGGRVSRNREPEIGWFDVELTDEGKKSGLFGDFPDPFPAFHWHEDTFDMPKGARPLMSSAACANQAFSWGEHILGLQFHLEITREDARAWLAAGAPKPRRYVQSAQQILGDPAPFYLNNRLMVKLLQRMAAR